MTPHHTALRLFYLLLLLALLFTQGCHSKPAPGVRFPITNGFHTTLPSPSQRILIWADPPLVDVAAEWLRTHHYSDVLMPAKHPLQNSRIAHNLSTSHAALAVAREMKAEVVLVIERGATKDGALIQSDCGALYHANVEVRGLSVQNGDTALRGSAYFPHCVDFSEKTLRSLTCQAFATAWGYRPSGQLDIPSNLMCTTGESAPVPTR
ncbi:MAG TPA: hypothetical protein VJL88_13420 [Nitrospira sp.]|nr:hypothetical protein [Nitrospira sp.]